MVRSDALSRVLSPVVAAAAAAGTAVAAGNAPVHAMTAASGPAGAAFTVAIGGLVLASAAAGVLGRGPELGILLAACSVCRLAPIWVGLEVGQNPIRTIAAVLALLLAVPLFLIVSTKPTGRVERSIWLPIGGAVATSLALGATVLRDPFRDLSCWIDCTALRPAVAWPAGAAAARVALAVLWLAFAVAAVWVTGRALFRARRSGTAVRIFVGAVTVPAALATVAAAAAAAATPATPDDAKGLGLSIALDILLAVLAVGVILVATDAVRRRRLLTSLASLLGDSPQPASLSRALSSVVGARVQVAYPRVGSEEPEPPTARGTRESTITLRRGSEPVAVLTIEQADVDAAVLVERIGSAATVAIDNGRLQAEDAARLRELAESRRRVVASADEARRQIERDLHDGSQAQLVALLLHLGLARSEAQEAGSAQDAVILGALTERTEHVLGRLREVSHGVYPAVVEQLGLGAALRSLFAARAAPYRISVDGEERADAKAAQAAYMVAAGAIAALPLDAAAEVDAHAADGSLTIRIRSISETPPIDLEDRIAAVGGTIVASGDCWAAVIPCGS